MPQKCEQVVKLQNDKLLSLATQQKVVKSNKKKLVKKFNSYKKKVVIWGEKNCNATKTFVKVWLEVDWILKKYTHVQSFLMIF